MNKVKWSRIRVHTINQFHNRVHAEVESFSLISSEI